MNRAHIDAILSGQHLLGAKIPAARPVIATGDDMEGAAAAMNALCAHRTAARPLVLDSQQLPPIF